MANQYCICARGVEFAVGFDNQLIAAKHPATDQGQWLSKALSKWRDNADTAALDHCQIPMTRLMGKPVATATCRSAIWITLIKINKRMGEKSKPPMFGSSDRKGIITG